MEQLDRITERLISQFFIEVEASGRHVHLSKEDALKLFGQPLSKESALSQPGQFVTNERVTLVGPRGEIANVAVLGPERTHSQVEISQTDARQLGIPAPVRLSGDTAGTPGICVRSKCSEVTISEGVMIAHRHLHITPEDAVNFRVQDGQTVKLRCLSERPIVFEDVIVRVSHHAATRVHLDYDEANACGYQKGDLGMIVS